MVDYPQSTMADKDLRELQERLSQKNIPEFVSFFPKELLDSDTSQLTNSIAQINLAEVSKDHGAIPFLCDFIGIPIETNLDTVERLLSKYKPVSGGFFENEPQKTTQAANESEFKTLRLNGEEHPKALKTNSNNDNCNVDEYILERISKEILETNLNLTWDDIVGLEDTKKIINEIVVWPMLRPDIFTGLRGPPKGLLLFGPPGTGKTMIGKCIASQCKATFFSISASSLTSKWVGEGEKMVRALFFLARKMAPSVIFVDEIDSLLTQRSENENEGSRRIKTEFLVQFDGAGVKENDRILLIGATNRPQEIDEAARRRLVKRIYVALPDFEGRRKMITQLMKEYSHSICESGLDEIARYTEGYSGSDMFNLCREASMEPLREIRDIHNFNAGDARPISKEDFKKAMKQIRKSVSEGDLEGYRRWNDEFGCMPVN